MSDELKNDKALHDARQNGVSLPGDGLDAGKRKYGSRVNASTPGHCHACDSDQPTDEYVTDLHPELVWSLCSSCGKFWVEGGNDKKNLGWRKK